MKLLIILLSLIVSTGAFSQTKRDYENFMHKFQQFYNANKADSLCNLGSNSLGMSKNTLFTAKELEQCKKEYGNIVSYKYIKVDTLYSKNKRTLIKVYGSNKNFIMSVSLDKENKFENFNFSLKTPYTESLLLKD